MKIFLYSTYPFLLQPLPRPATPFLNNQISSKLKHIDVVIKCFFLTL